MRNPFARAEPTQTERKDIAPGTSHSFDLPAIAEDEDDQLASNAQGDSRGASATGADALLDRGPEVPGWPRTAQKDGILSTL